MSGITVSARIKALTQVARYVRNGKVPDAQFQSEITELTNQAAAFRGKEIFRNAGSIAAIPSSFGVGERKRHRFAFHSGPYCDKVIALIVFAPTDHGTQTNAYGQLLITTTAGVTVGAAKRYSPLYIPAGILDSPGNFTNGFASVDVSPDTDYYGYISDFDQARILSVVVYEQNLAPDTSNGYLTPSVAGNGPIYSSERADIVANAVTLWKRAGSQLLNWCTEDDGFARSTASGTNKNIVDDTSTLISASTPGFTLDLTGKASLTSAGVACKIAVYGIRTGSAAQQGVIVKDSAGAPIVILNSAPAAAGWFVGTLTLPATKAKYDLHYYATSGTLAVYAVSIWEYEP